jgi:hypothetical protein
VKETLARLHLFVAVFPYRNETILQHNRQHYYYSFKANDNQSNTKAISAAYSRLMSINSVLCAACLQQTDVYVQNQRRLLNDILEKSCIGFCGQLGIREHNI